MLLGKVRYLMRNYRLVELEKELITIVSKVNILTDPEKTQFYRQGIRVGGGNASMVVFPQNLLQLWKVLRICINFNKIIIMQAANTGLTGGSTPFGNEYDRDIIIINTVSINQLIVLNQGMQVLAFPGTTLFKLEDNLRPIGRGPHSVIGSSCIGASVIGGVCNNSGGNLVNRGPAYTELSLFAQLTKEGELILVNHLGIELGESPIEILTNLEAINFDPNKVSDTNKLASDLDYKTRVRDINSQIPARFNADKRRLFESSGCAGKVAVFAVRLDTFPLPKKEKVFFVGTNDPTDFTDLRIKILSENKVLPDMGEYMHKSYFDGAAKYCKDNFLFIKYFGTKSLQKIFRFKQFLDTKLSGLEFLPNNITDIHLQFFSDILPNHLPKRVCEYRNKFEHYMIFLASDDSIDCIRKTLNEERLNRNFDFFECTEDEGKDILLHRYVAGSAPSRYKKLNSHKAGELLPLDIALPRNCSSWHDILPEYILSQMSESFQMGHFLCMVFHWDFVVKEGVDFNKLKESILLILDKNNAKYPAEHNVGHIYQADTNLSSFYRNLDPTNSFNAGIGKTSKKKNYE